MGRKAVAKRTGRPHALILNEVQEDLAVWGCYDYGYDNAQLAELFKVSLSTFYRYLRAHPVFWETIRQAKYIHDNHDVENALLTRAKGFEYDEVTKELRAGADGEDAEMVITKIVRKKVAPDTGAAKHWMNNRDPQKWGEKIEVEHSIADKAADAMMKRSEEYEAAKLKRKAIMAPG